MGQANNRVRKISRVYPLIAAYDDSGSSTHSHRAMWQISGRRFGAAAMYSLRTTMGKKPSVSSHTTHCELRAFCTRVMFGAALPRLTSMIIPLADFFGFPCRRRRQSEDECDAVPARIRDQAGKGRGRRVI
jgi:hypothetical protein